MELAGDYASAADAYQNAANVAQSESDDEALRFYARALSLLPPQARSRFAIHEAREQILRHKGCKAEQQIELRALRTIADRRNDPFMKAVAFNRLAREALDSANLVDAQSFADEAHRDAVQAHDLGFGSGVLTPF